MRRRQFFRSILGFIAAPFAAKAALSVPREVYGIGLRERAYQTWWIRNELLRLHDLGWKTGRLGQDGEFIPT